LEMSIKWKSITKWRDSLTSLQPFCYLTSRTPADSLIALDGRVVVSSEKLTSL
jgi:hypothetical protein